MPRKQRFRVAGIPQLVHQRGHNGGDICRDSVDFRTLYSCLAEAVSEHDCEVHAYVLLKRGFYLLVTPRQPGSLSLAMQAVGRQYVPWFNAVQGRTGALWEGRYRACLVEPDLRVLDCCRFIAQQAREGGLGGEPGGCNRWSSGVERHRRCRDSLITPHSILSGLIGGPENMSDAYLKYCQTPLAERVSNEITHALERCLAYASEGYKDWIESTLSHSVRLRRPGRPRRLHSAELLAPH